MAITDLPIFSMLRTRMDWAQARQQVLAENVANADTPNYRARDLAPPKFDDALKARAMAGSVALLRTQSGHITGATGGAASGNRAEGSAYEKRLSGNAVNLEEEMMKVAGNQMDYNTAASLYTRSLGLIKIAVGKR